MFKIIKSMFLQNVIKIFRNLLHNLIHVLIAKIALKTLLKITFYAKFKKPN